MSVAHQTEDAAAEAVTKVARSVIVKISDNVKFLLLIIVLLVTMASPWIWPDHHVVIMYDCRIAEISPDMPVAAKEQCRRKMEK